MRLAEQEIMNTKQRPLIKWTGGEYEEFPNTKNFRQRLMQLLYLQLLISLKILFPMILIL
jgi:hypothetical protein